jgi:hypothetical protein
MHASLRRLYDFEDKQIYAREEFSDASVLIEEMAWSIDGEELKGNFLWGA